MNAARPPDRVDAFLESLGHVEPPPDLVADVMGRVRRESPARRERRWPMVAAAAAVVVIVLGLTAMWIGSPIPNPTESPRPSAPVSPQPTATPIPTSTVLGTLAGTWVTIADAPIQGRQGHTAVWTGTEMLVWGGEPGPARLDDARSSDGSDGAAYDPRTDTWRALPTAPIAGRVRHSAAWTGEQMLVWGGADRFGNARGDGAVYDPATNTWRVLPAAPFAASGLQAATWARDRWVVVDGAPDADNPVHLNVAAYRPDSKGWEQLPGLDVPSATWYSVAWARDEVVLLVNPLDGNSKGFRLWLGTSEQGWVSIADPPTLGLSPDRVEIWTGTEIVLRSSVPGEGDGVVAFDAALDRWRTAAVPPLGLGGGSNTWTGTLAIFGLGTTGMERLTIYDPTRDGWFGLPPLGSQIRQFATQTWAGERLLVWGGFEGESILRPPGGFAFVPAARYVDAAHDPDGFRTTLRVEVADASGTLVEVRPPTPAEVDSVDRSRVGSNGAPAMAIPFGDRSVFVYWITGGDAAARLEVGPDGRSIGLVAVPTYGEAMPIGHAVILTFDRPIGSDEIELSFWAGSR